MADAIFTLDEFKVEGQKFVIGIDSDEDSIVLARIGRGLDDSFVILSDGEIMWYVDL